MEEVLAFPGLCEQRKACQYCGPGNTMSEKTDMVREEGNDLTTFTSTRFGAIMRHACSKNNLGLQNYLGPASVHQDTIPDEIYVEIGDVRRP